MKNRPLRIGLILTLSIVLALTSICSVFGGATFHTKDTLISMFKALCDSHPTEASYAIIGKTYENRDIYIFKIGNPNGGSVLWDGCLHGWEDLGSEVEYQFATWLLTSKTSEAGRILERNCVLFIPVVNVDSNERQNRDFVQCQYGVDLNRNFPTGWSPSSPSNQLSYSGQSAGSEPETQTMHSLFQAYRPDFYVNTHYGGGPYLSYVSGNLTRINWVVNRISQLSSQTGVTPYEVQSGGGGGCAVTDANSFGVCSWLFEMATENSPIATGKASGACYMHTAHSLSDVQNYFFPKTLPILRAMCESCEKPPTSAPTSAQVEMAFTGTIQYGP
jgi:hypothetical protein